MVLKQSHAFDSHDARVVRFGRTLNTIDLAECGKSGIHQKKSWEPAL